MCDDANRFFSTIELFHITYFKVVMKLKCEGKAGLIGALFASSLNVTKRIHQPQISDSICCVSGPPGEVPALSP